MVGIATYRQRTAPSELLARLREIDSAAELLYVGEGRWLLGVVQPSGAAELEGCRRITRELERPLAQQSPRRYMAGHLMREGFLIVAEYEARDPGGAIVEDFRKADWTYRHRRDEAFAEKLDASRLERSVIVAPDSDRRRDLRWAFGRRRLFSPGVLSRPDFHRVGRVN
jgi:hypothetical protein